MRGAPLFCALALFVPVLALAQSYPTRTVRVIVPYPPGGGNDLIARATADELTKRTGQQFIVDNRAGGSTIIGAELAARAPADGYTLLVTSGTTFAIVPNLKARIPYDPVQDFAPVSLLAVQPYMLVVNPSLPVRNVQQLIALATANPGKIAFASPAVGAGGHLAAELFKIMTGTDLQHVPYRGASQALTDLVSGQVSLMFSSPASVHAFVAGGKLRAIAITSAQRSPLAPGVPTVAEGGVPGYESIQWNAMAAPRGTPQAAIDRLKGELVAAMKLPAFRERLLAQGFDGATSSPQALADLIKADLARYAKFIKTLGIKDE
jgi:tripartite-type tricarboxylate transporter receptor subunit TctC